MIPNTIADIETGPDREKALALLPPFDPDEIKCGNLGPEKAQAKIEEARKSHEAEWLDKAALRPETGKILAIGYYHNDLGVETITDRNVGSERSVLEDFWRRVGLHMQNGGQIITLNGNSFDLPYIVIRSIIHGLHIPSGIRSGRYFNSKLFADLRDDWLMGRNPLEHKSSMDHIAKSLGLGGKTGHGKDFAAMYESHEIGALTYLVNDVLLTAKIAQKFGYDTRPTTETFAEWERKYLQSQQKPEQKPTPDDLF